MISFCPTCGRPGYDPTDDGVPQPSTSSPGIRRMALEAVRDAVRAAKTRGGRP